MLRDLFPVSDLWRSGSVCRCGDPMKADHLAHYEANESSAILHCLGCSRVIRVTQIVEELSPGHSSLEATI